MSSVLGTRTLSTEIGAQRRVEARIGQLLGAAENLGPATLVHDQRLAHDDRHDFRILARGFDADARARRDATFLAFTPTGVNPKNLTERRFRGYWGQTDKTKGQRAMAVAMIYPESQQGKRNAATSSVSGDVSATRIKMARTILKWAPELASQVLAGAAVLDKAYSIATDRKTAEEVPQKRLDALRAQDPDLAENHGPATVGRDPRLDRGDRSDFRILARGFDADAHLDDNEWRRSRRALVTLLRQARESHPEIPVMEWQRFEVGFRAEFGGGRYYVKKAATVERERAKPKR